MIVKFKLYESINEDKPEIGDYVICEDSTNGDKNLLEFENTHIGRIFADDHPLEEWNYLVKYENFPFSLRSFFTFSENSRAFSLSEIKHWSKNKEDLEHVLNAKKYNL